MRKSAEECGTSVTRPQTLVPQGFVARSMVSAMLRSYAQKEQKMKLRDYQIDCIDTIDAQPPGAYLAQMATGLGK